MIKCVKCGKEILWYRKYCSQKCYHSIPISDVTRIKLSDASKRQIPWNLGLTKETDERVKKSSEKAAKSRIGKIPWNFGLTEETDERVKNSSDKMRSHHHGWKHMKGRVSWAKGKKRPNISGNKNGAFGKIFYPNPYQNQYLGHTVRSSWEEKICLLLKENKIEYEYEPETFKLEVNGKNCTYTPDIKIGNVYIEIKGVLRDHQINKMAEFNMTHKFLIISADKFIDNLTAVGLNYISYKDVLGDNLIVKSLRYDYGIN